MSNTQLNSSRASGFHENEISEHVSENNALNISTTDDSLSTHATSHVHTIAPQHTTKWSSQLPPRIVIENPSHIGQVAKRCFKKKGFSKLEKRKGDIELEKQISLTLQGEQLSSLLQAYRTPQRS